VRVAVCILSLSVPSQFRLRLGRLVVVPLGTIGVLAALLTWEIEHVGSVMLALALTSGGIVAGVLVARRVRNELDELSRHYESLLRIADEQSRQAESANRMKDEFLATLSHELRTPLNAILGWARLLASGNLDARQAAKAVQAIERAGWAQSRVIEDLLDVSHIVSGRLAITPRPTLIQPLVQAAVDTQRTAAAAKQITVNLDLDRTLGPIEVDADRFHQIVWNLVSNAVKFTPEGGGVTVRLRAEGEQISLSVQDSGIGFAPPVAAHLFERFCQADGSPTRQYGGLGLGLVIVRHLVELHGGTVTALSSGAGRGSVFEVRLPLRRSEPQAAEAPPARGGDDVSLRGITVLVVDDDPQALSFARFTLEQYGAQVITASSAREARARFARQMPDVLLSDLVMPEQDGLDLIRDIRALDAQHGGRTPAAALSGLARGEDRRRAFAAGYQMHVAKPIDPYELAAAVEALARAESSSIRAGQ
jgi:signal transduction histidine kinase/ActR/RegA family two-component response regulator